MVPDDHPPTTTERTYGRYGRTAPLPPPPGDSDHPPPMPSERFGHAGDARARHDAGALPLGRPRRQCPDRLGHGERRCVLAHDAPARVPGARGARPGGAAPGGHGPTRASGALEPAAAGLPLARDETARPAAGLPCGPGPPRPGGMRLLRAPTAGRRALAHRPWALTREAEPARHAASSATTDPRCVAAARAVRRAWRGRTVACGALPDSLLLRTVGRTSGGDSAGSRLSLVHMHPRYRGTPPHFQCLANLRLLRYPIPAYG
jgi:hypothetical protein